MNLLRTLLARLMWRLQHWGWLYHVCRWPYYGGRRLDWYPVRCEECGWAGPLRWCYHGYSGSGDGEVEPSDECPACGCDDLENL